MLLSWFNWKTVACPSVAGTSVGPGMSYYDIIVHHMVYTWKTSVLECLGT